MSQGERQSLGKRTTRRGAMWRRHARWPTCKKRAPRRLRAERASRSRRRWGRAGRSLWSSMTTNPTPTRWACSWQRPPRVAQDTTPATRSCTQGVDFDVVHRQRHSLAVQAEHRVDRQNWRNDGQALYLVIRAARLHFQQLALLVLDDHPLEVGGTNTPSASSRSRTHGARHRRSATPIWFWPMGRDPRGWEGQAPRHDRKPKLNSEAGEFDATQEAGRSQDDRNSPTAKRRRPTAKCGIRRAGGGGGGASTTR